MIRENDLERLPAVAVYESAARSCVTVGIFDIGLYVIDRRAVGEIRSADFYRAFIEVNLRYSDRAEAQTIGSEGRAGGEYSDPGVSSEPRRPDRGFEMLSSLVGILGSGVVGMTRPVQAEAPYQPDIVEFFEPAQRIGLVVWRLQLDSAA